MTHLSPYSQTWGKHLAQMLEALPQALGKGLKHKHKCFKKISFKYKTKYYKNAYFKVMGNVHGCKPPIKCHISFSLHSATLNNHSIGADDGFVLSNKLIKCL